MYLFVYLFDCLFRELYILYIETKKKTQEQEQELCTHEIVVSESCLYDYNKKTKSIRISDYMIRTTEKSKKDSNDILYD